MDPFIGDNTEAWPEQGGGGKDPDFGSDNKQQCLTFPGESQTLNEKNVHSTFNYCRIQ